MKSILLSVLLLATPALARKATYTWKLQPPVGARMQTTGETTIRLTEVLPHVAGMPVQGKVKVEVLLICHNV